MMNESLESSVWKTKPSDRFVLKWIKVTLSARITPRLLGVSWIRPWMVTLTSSIFGVAAGTVYGLGWGVPAGILAAIGQILDGVDGQLARLSKRESAAGAFLDSVMDRYADGALVIGLMVYLARSALAVPLWQILILGALALIGSGLISYSSARAASLDLNLGKPTLASKGTRTTVIILGALFSPISLWIPFASLCYLVVHSNVVVLLRTIRVYRQTQTQQL